MLTNITLLADPDVRAALMRADLVAPSLDSVSGERFQRLHRPCPGVTPEGGVAGLRDFVREYPGEVWLEIFIVPGINDRDDEIQRVKGAIATINPDRVQVNTLDRPGTGPAVRPAPLPVLERIAAELGGEVAGAESTERVQPGRGR
ncbi:hypothetical protein [Methanoculleus sp.]|uniref:hypothetical protein n=1 Tax=Methanoculleus sp. TaxID=90427 RepID=UPI00262C7B68|nr:hypothetical protein [Methanoculleus sp.]MDI6867315.1 hypothetical protein [Methanoculleus sp.]